MPVRVHAREVPVAEGLSGHEAVLDSLPSTKALMEAKGFLTRCRHLGAGENLTG